MDLAILLDSMFLGSFGNASVVHISEGIIVWTDQKCIEIHRCWPALGRLFEHSLRSRSVSFRKKQSVWTTPAIPDV